MNDVKSRPSSDITSSTRSRFLNENEFSYRFKSTVTFQKRRQPIRPVTSPEKAFRRPGINQNALDTIASVQSPLPDFNHYVFGDGIMMLREHKTVSPSVFVQLDKMLRKQRKASPLPELVQAKKSLSPKKKMRNHVFKTNQILRSQTADKPKRRYQSTGIQTEGSIPTNASRRPSTVSEVVTSYLTNDNKKERKSFYRGSGTTRDGINDVFERCTRCSHIPDIQLEGRPLNRFLPTINNAMATQHCEILGAEACPDCIRTRAQIRHQNICQTTVEPNAIDVYKLFVVNSKVPNLELRDVKRKVYDGQISSTLNNNIFHMDLDAPHSSKPESEKELNKIISHSRSFLTKNTFQAIPEVPSPFERYNETDSDSEDEEISSAKIKIERHESSDYYERMKVEFSENNDVKSSAKPIFEDFVDQDIVFKDAETKEDIAENISVNISSPTARVSSAYSEYFESLPSKQHTPRNTHSIQRNKVTLQKRGRAFNKGVIPSPTFFYSVSDLFHRIKESKDKFPQKRNSFDFTLAAAHYKNEENENTQEKENIINSGSDSESEMSPRSLKSLMSFEPPIFYAKKSRYLSLMKPVSTNISSRPTTTVV